MRAEFFVLVLGLSVYGCGSLKETLLDEIPALNQARPIAFYSCLFGRQELREHRPEGFYHNFDELEDGTFRLCSLLYR